MFSESSKGKPVPVRFEMAEAQFLGDAARETGLPISEIVRRSVRLLKRERDRQNSFGFAMELSRG